MYEKYIYSIHTHSISIKIKIIMQLYKKKTYQSTDIITSFHKMLSWNISSLLSVSIQMHIYICTVPNQ